MGNGENNEQVGQGCIPEWERKILQTDPGKQVLFIRPKCWFGNDNYDYWSGFAELFPCKPNKPWILMIPPFENLNIEVIIIGHPQNPYPGMQNFDYDPANIYDPNKEPEKPDCDIMEIICKGLKGKCFTTEQQCEQSEIIICQYMNRSKNGGHTYFDEGSNQWRFDTFGHTPPEQGEYGYRKPAIYPFPLKNYFNEGAYEGIKKGNAPMERNIDAFCPSKPCYGSMNCFYLKQCYDISHCSPLALNSQNYEEGRPNGYVQFNEITFYPSTKMINGVGRIGRNYTLKDVFQRTIVHEIGHGLLNGEDADHCGDDPECIMYQYPPVDWDLLDFAPNNLCRHRRGGTMDISQRIHNNQH